MTNEKDVLGDIGQYTEDGIQIHTMLRDMFLEKNNIMGMSKHQGSLDTLRDIKRILSGEKIATLAEMRAEIKKVEDAKGDYMR